MIGSLFSALGIDLPNTGTVVEPRTVIVGLLLGTGITVLAALMPARRATRSRPSPGCATGSCPQTTSERRRRTAAGVVLTGLGAAAMALGIFGALDPGEAWVGVGAVGVFLGVALLSPLLVTPIASVVGAPLEAVGGVPGQAGPRERHPQSRPHRVDGRGADDRAGAGLVRGRVRGRDPRARSTMRSTRR